MALKQRFNIEPNFSMASMTDVIFLLLIFFMITSTIVVPNSIKVLLPKSQQQAQAKPLTRVTIDKNLNFYVANGNETERQVPFEAITPFLKSAYSADPNIFVALYADEEVPYREIVRVLDIANQNKFKMVLMTRPK
ncbi:MAG TPA: biopolymer transporter ExbD [Dysgonamonadaceae bacterium]|uniref:ExbD/TolR family protein n=1 Tax=Seramator thermalis TaxID=2496270 RepID=UPI00101B69FC|nr:biopolymer transporter ExbD [Seramator thermalis]MBP7181266.1 biopolymer transporter ExbD [Dysgonamonadaceae bacterium]MBP9031798.1 biopolymer transporter ExbD [Dysgonamonadaceae bacterium]HOM63912.1 biopolymer transporter ExbD [Dysgonamonadaceae bacterium]HOT64855.1 biopolymer transporter ExbD [Dysgonamonadaceae bacterium]HOV36857.1 biopolymer transporter ExbD [Dysgonamonadaceae bacterium]